jgi:predicted RNA polymerase sigma factor
MDASRPDVHINIGAILARLGKLPEAAEAYQTALRLDRHNAQAARALQYIASKLAASSGASAALQPGLYR